MKIGAVKHFEHVSHIGNLTPTEVMTDLGQIPPDWKQVFVASGIKMEQLDDKSTSLFYLQLRDSLGVQQCRNKPSETISAMHIDTFLNNEHLYELFRVCRMENVLICNTSTFVKRNAPKKTSCCMNCCKTTRSIRMTRIASCSCATTT